MTKFYCLKCKAHTETQEDEDWDQERRILFGSCAVCGKTKVTFTNASGTFRKKSAKELATARIQRKERTFNRKAKKLGRQILDADKRVQRSVRKTLKDM
jgi:hypothetical protein